MILLAACKPSIDEFVPERGNADFQTYLAVGDSWTAGMADASLYLSGQENSFPNILAKQFKEAGGGDFTQPLMLDDYGIGLATGIPTVKLEMGFHADCIGNVNLVPDYADVDVNMANLAPLPAGTVYNNLSTPGLKTFYMGVPGMNQLNPYYKRFASAGAATMNDEIALVNPTFFTLWLGSYDALDYAITGGADPINHGLTDVTTFAGSLQVTLVKLTENGAKGVVGNIPDVLDAPFFHTIPYNVLVLDQATADMLNYNYDNTVNPIIKSLNRTDTIHFVAGPNPVLIADGALPWGFRHILSTELVLMSTPQDSLKCGQWGSVDPIPGQYILDEAEIGNITTAISDYNGQINQLIASASGTALVDMYSVMKTITNEGMVYDGVKVGAGFVTGNFYSTDGMNPTPLGSAVVAHHFIEAINVAFQANVPQVIVSDYPAVKLP